jgi:hypothetical protein
MEKCASKNLFIALIAGVMLITLSFGCVKLGKTTPAKPAIASAVENVKDADDHLATAEKHLRADPPAVPEAKTEIGSARDQLTFAQSDLKAATKNTSVNDAKAKKWDEVQDDLIGPRGMSYVYGLGAIVILGAILRFSGLAFLGPVGAILSRLGSFLLAIGTMGLTAIQWIAEEVWQWISKKKQPASTEAGK